MEPQHDDRRLTTILSADVVAYSRLMAADEAGTVAQLKTHRKELLDPKTAEYHGRVVKLMGDGTLMEFGSVVDAVLFAVEVQRAMAERNAAVPEDRQITYRVGINIGDIIVDGDDIYGDGVNVAARLQALADPGSVCISRSVYNQIKGKVELGFEDLGEQEVKNIPEPVRVFRVLIEPGAAGKVVGKAKKPIKSWRWPAVAAGVVVLVAVAGVATWLRPWEPRVEPASIARMAFPLPEKPSIAVLPFDNMSGDPEQEYFVDGITEDIITDLSKISGLFVVARNSTFTYKGKPVKVQQVAEELGVRYVLEGSVRKADNQVRITAQLVDATTGGHLWAERYDRDLKDIFALQDEITKNIVAGLEVKLTEEERVARRYTDNLEAYDLFLRGREYFVRGTEEAYAQARQMYEKAVELDPNFAGAYAELAYMHWWLRASDPGGVPAALERALELAQKAVELDDSLPLAHARLGWIYLRLKQHDQAIAEAERAVALDPNSAEGLANLGFILNWAVRPEEGIDYIKKAMRLDPHYPVNYVFRLGQAYYLMKQNEQAIAIMKRAVTRNPDQDYTHRHLAVLYVEAGRDEEARAAVAESLRIKPKDTLEVVKQRCLYRQDPAVWERFLGGLRKAGFPESVG